MIDLKSIPAAKKDLDSYEVEHLFHSWSYQPAQAPLRVLTAKGVRFKTEDGRERLDFSSCFVSHNIGACRISIHTASEIPLSRLARKSARLPSSSRRGART